mmetsp:Transcript_17326/g.40026  ORF Transcript_17326/g.40026 Transcript_17326/m.40026 type:complete len:147 (-) Transcript_17326:709-1149(-)
MACYKLQRLAFLALLSIVTLAATTVAFVPKNSRSISGPTTFSSATPKSFTSVRDNSATQLSERQWNFNEGQSPWGMKQNAEIWNGRVAQVAFVWVFLQELVTGKGVLQGIDEGNWFFLFNEGLFGIFVFGLTGWLAIQGDDDYTKE